MSKTSTTLADVWALRTPLFQLTPSLPWVSPCPAHGSGPHFSPAQGAQTFSNLCCRWPFSAVLEQFGFPWLIPWLTWLIPLPLLDDHWTVDGTFSLSPLQTGASWVRAWPVLGSPVAPSLSSAPCSQKVSLCTDPKTDGFTGFSGIANILFQSPQKWVGLKLGSWDRDFYGFAYGNSAWLTVACTIVAQGKKQPTNKQNNNNQPTNQKP